MYVVYTSDYSVQFTLECTGCCVIYTHRQYTSTLHYIVPDPNIDLPCLFAKTNVDPIKNKLILEYSTLELGVRGGEKDRREAEMIRKRLGGSAGGGMDQEEAGRVGKSRGRLGIGEKDQEEVERVGKSRGRLRRGGKY